jgi:hypothetical protein
MVATCVLGRKPPASIRRVKWNALWRYNLGGLKRGMRSVGVAIPCQVIVLRRWIGIALGDIPAVVVKSSGKKIRRCK